MLVAATTSVVLLAFLLPLALLVSRAATNQAVSDATAQSQSLVGPAANGTAADVSDALAQIQGDLVTVVRMPDGTVVGDTAALDGVDAGVVPRATSVTRTNVGGAVVRQPVFRPDGEAAIVTLVPESRLRQGVTKAWLVLGLLGVFLVLMSLVVADRLARSITSPITALANAAERLGHGDLDARVEPAGPPEVHDVGLAINQLAARIRELLASEREAVADLSHRLRTPVTALRLDAEGLPNPDDRDRLLGDVDELNRQVDAVIREARRPMREGGAARCDARAVVAERAGFWRVLAEDQDRDLALDLPDGPCLVRASADDLGAAVDALIGNVFSHTPEGTDFSVSVHPLDAAGVLVVVDDDGPGFDDHDVVHRGESRGGSTGLGLDIARRTAAASGGDVRVSASPGGGARVAMRLAPPAE